MRDNHVINLDYVTNSNIVKSQYVKKSLCKKIIM